MQALKSQLNLNHYAGSFIMFIFDPSRNVKCKTVIFQFNTGTIRNNSPSNKAITLTPSMVLDIRGSDVLTLVQ